MARFNKMSNAERYATLSLSSIYIVRILGLFMILPVFSLYAENLPGSTPLLLGLGLGIYGLTQACLQIPFGLMSHIFGRKRIILTALLLFAVGSIIAASAHTMLGVIVGRALQGAGALGSALTGLAADLIVEEHRSKAMATIGLSIAITFAVAMVFGPLFHAWVGVTGIFWITTGLAFGGMIMLLIFVPTPQGSRFHSDSEFNPYQIRPILKNRQLLRQNLGVFLLHAILVATFIVTPIALKHSAGLIEKSHWFVYLPVLAFAFVAMMPFIVIAESRYRVKQVMMLAILTIAISQLVLWEWHSSALLISIMLFLFFTAFMTLEATLPSLVAKIAPAGLKGTAMGVYSTSQFLGIFFGGIVGGWVFSSHDLSAVFLLCTVMAVIWLVFVANMNEPRYLSSYIMNIGRMNKADAQQLQAQLAQIPGVVEARVMYLERVAHLKIDKTLVKPEDLQAMSVSTTH